jgi:hypothetical protein
MGGERGAARGATRRRFVGKVWLRSKGGSSGSSSVVCSLGVEGCGEGYVGILAEEGHKKGTRVVIVRQNPHALLNTKRAGGEMGEARLSVHHLLDRAIGLGGAEHGANESAAAECLASLPACCACCNNLIE